VQDADEPVGEAPEGVVVLDAAGRMDSRGESQTPADVGEDVPVNLNGSAGGDAPVPVVA
jgi:hypothetical protein